MANPRASIFDEAEEIDVSGFAPKPALPPAGPSAEEVRVVSEAANFRSREAAAPNPAARPKRQRRLYRTGRNVQFNVKASQETVDAFYTLCDKTGWVLGYTLERAIAALRKELNGK